jgi:hypothetical protein
MTNVARFIVRPVVEGRVESLSPSDKKLTVPQKHRIFSYLLWNQQLTEHKTSYLPTKTDYELPEKLLRANQPANILHLVTACY